MARVQRSSKGPPAGTTLLCCCRQPALLAEPVRPACGGPARKPRPVRDGEHVQLASYDRTMGHDCTRDGCSRLPWQRQLTNSARAPRSKQSHPFMACELCVLFQLLSAHAGPRCPHLHGSLQRHLVRAGCPAPLRSAVSVSVSTPQPQPQPQPQAIALAQADAAAAHHAPAHCSSHHTSLPQPPHHPGMPPGSALYSQFLEGTSLLHTSHRCTAPCACGP